MDRRERERERERERDRMMMMRRHHQFDPRREDRGRGNLHLV